MWIYLGKSGHGIKGSSVIPRCWDHNITLKPRYVPGPTGAKLTNNWCIRQGLYLGGCPGWSESLLGAHAILLVLSWGGLFAYLFQSTCTDSDYTCIAKPLTLAYLNHLWCYSNIRRIRFYYPRIRAKDEDQLTNNADRSDCSRSLIRVYTVCHSICMFWTPYSMVKQLYNSNFRVTTANFSGVWIFRIFTVL